MVRLNFQENFFRLFWKYFNRLLWWNS